MVDFDGYETNAEIKAGDDEFAAVLALLHSGANFINRLSPSRRFELLRGLQIAFYDWPSRRQLIPGRDVYETEDARNTRIVAAARESFFEAAIDVLKR